MHARGSARRSRAPGQRRVSCPNFHAVAASQLGKHDCYAGLGCGKVAAALASDARASAVFERLGKSGRHAVILPLLKARTPETRARILARAIARLAAQNSLT